MPLIRCDYKLGNMKIGKIKSPQTENGLVLQTYNTAGFWFYEKISCYCLCLRWSSRSTDWWFVACKCQSLAVLYGTRRLHNVYSRQQRLWKSRFEFESAVFRHLGVNEMKDQLEGVKFLKSKTLCWYKQNGSSRLELRRIYDYFVDDYLSWCVKVAVAGRPGNWLEHHYEVNGIGERYMDTPQKNPGKGFKMKTKAF